MPDIDAFEGYLLDLQQRICATVEGLEQGLRFREDRWERPAGGCGRTRVLEGGAVFERAGVNFSHVHGDSLPSTASARRPELAGRGFRALGVSVVLHPRNPY
ncbi:MAG TPA: coproporphyrinogen III oxidase, partial [Gammaproteobacteria bacterium]